MYSLSSSPLADPTTCEFVFSVVHMRLPGAGAVAAAEGAGAGGSSRLFEGVCTSWMESFLPVGRAEREQRQAARMEGVLATGAAASAGAAEEEGEGGAVRAADAAALPACLLPVYQKPGGSFSHPASLAAPIVMIGPGTGVAPFRGFLQERRERRRRGQGESEVGESWLFFGCRRRDEDYIYGDELEEFESDGTLTHLEVAFSRETEEKVRGARVSDGAALGCGPLVSPAGLYGHTMLLRPLPLAARPVGATRWAAGLTHCELPSGHVVGNLVLSLSPALPRYLPPSLSPSLPPALSRSRPSLSLPALSLPSSPPPPLSPAGVCATQDGAAWR